MTDIADADYFEALEEVYNYFRENRHVLFKADQILIATTYIAPISTLTDVQNDLTNKSGKIISDFTLINGTSSNRYISASFENGFSKK